MSEFLVLDTDRDLFGGLKGEKFRLLLKYCFDEADYFSLSKWDRTSYPNYVEDMLEPYCIEKIKTAKWFAYNGVDTVMEMVYKASEETLKIISEYYQDVFLENRKRIPKKKFEQIGKQFLYPSDLEDICIFKGKQMIFGTLSHEYLCMARCISNKFEDHLLSIAEWKGTDIDACNFNVAFF